MATKIAGTDLDDLLGGRLSHLHDPGVDLDALKARTEKYDDVKFRRTFESDVSCLIKLSTDATSKQRTVAFDALFNLLCRNKLDKMAFTDMFHPGDDNITKVCNSTAVGASATSKVQRQIAAHREAFVSALNRLLSASSFTDTFADLDTATPHEFVECMLSALDTDVDSELDSIKKFLKEPGWIPRDGTTGDDNKDTRQYLSDVLAADKFIRLAETFVDNEGKSVYSDEKVVTSL
jgi:hypothetical protein